MILISALFCITIAISTKKLIVTFNNSDSEKNVLLSVTLYLLNSLTTAIIRPLYNTELKRNQIL